jgi:hypothetical protein
VPSGAVVTWGDRELGRTPLQDVAVPCGLAQVTIASRRFAPLSVTLNAAPDAPVRYLAPFGRFAAQLELRSEPSGALFAVDGVEAGMAPTDALVPLGSKVTVSATLEGRTWKQTVVVKKRKQYVRAKL